MSDARLDCYVVSSEDPSEFSEVVFAESEAAAKDVVASRGGFDADGLEATVHKEWNRYRHKGYVPATTLLDAGWYIECAECYHEVRDHGCDDEEHEDEVPVVKKSKVWCGPACRRAWLKERRERAKAEETLVPAARADVLRHWPKATIEDARLGLARHGPGYSVYVRFRFPGSKYGTVQWESAEPKIVHVPQGDLDAWQKFTASTGSLRASCSGGSAEMDPQAP